MFKTPSFNMIKHLSLEYIAYERDFTTKNDA